jgi:hypothetical protein
MEAQRWEQLPSARQSRQAFGAHLAAVRAALQLGQQGALYHLAPHADYLHVHWQPHGARQNEGIGVAQHGGAWQVEQGRPRGVEFVKCERHGAWNH